MIYGLFHGGYSYACPELDDAEELDSQSHAVRVFRSRVQGRDRRYPGIDDSAVFDLYFGSHPETMRDPYPDVRLSVGPRGGIRAERV